MKVMVTDEIASDRGKELAGNLRSVEISLRRPASAGLLFFVYVKTADYSSPPGVGSVCRWIWSRRAVVEATHMRMGSIGLLCATPKHAAPHC